MARLPRKISGKDLLKVFRKLGFEVVRQRGSHVFLRHPDGRRLTIPVYDIVPVNLLNWILAEANVSREEFFIVGCKCWLQPKRPHYPKKAI